MRLLASLVLLCTTIFLPIITDGAPPAPPPSFPDQIELLAPGYELVGGAEVFVACASDQTLRLSAYALRPDGTQGHTIFAVDVAQARLDEEPQYRPTVVTRGSIFGQPLGNCGIANVLSVIISDPDNGLVILQQGE